HAADRSFVSWNMARGKNHSVALFNFEIFVVIQSEPRERGHRLTLTTSGDDTDFLARVASNFFGPNDQARWNLQKTGLLCGFSILGHSSSEKAHYTAILFGLIDDQLQPRNGRSET